jgi:uncharacterized protein (DUF2147 family)
MDHTRLTGPLASAALLVFTALPALADAPTLEGDWRAVDGSSLVRIAACRGAAGLCATVIEEKPAPGEPSSLGKVVVRNLTASGNAWKGLYNDGTRDLPATVRPVGETLEFKVCMGPLCDTARFARVAAR